MALENLFAKNSKLLFNSVQPADCIIYQVLEKSVDFLDAGIDCFNLGLVLAHIIKGNAADWDFQKVVNIFVCNRANQFFCKWLKAVFYSLDYAFFCFLLFDFFIDSLFNKDSLQGAQVELFGEVFFFKLKLCLKNSNKLFCVMLDYLSTGHLHRHVIFNYKEVTVDCLLAVCKGVKGIYNVLCVNAALQTDFNIYFICGVILN